MSLKLVFHWWLCIFRQASWFLWGCFFKLGANNSTCVWVLGESICWHLLTTWNTLSAQWWHSVIVLLVLLAVLMELLKRYFNIIIYFICLCCLWPWGGQYCHIWWLFWCVVYYKSEFYWTSGRRNIEEPSS